MIVTRQKSLDDLLSHLGDLRRVFIVGCGQCATVCKTGGEAEIAAMAEALAARGKEVSGTAIFDEPCHIPKTQRDMRGLKDTLAASDAVLVLACGAGTQSVCSSTDLPVAAGLDTLFLGNTRRFGEFEQRCSLCGNCLLASTGGLCPVTLCAKGLMNGPCGGMDQGKCETGETECGWVLIYRKLAERGTEEKLLEPSSPRDHSTCAGPSRHSAKK